MSSFLCCVIGRPPWQRATRGRPNEMVVEINFATKKLAVGALRLSSGNGYCDLGTGLLIHNSLVLTSHLNLPNKQSAENEEFVLADGYFETSSSSTPQPSERFSRVLTRKLLPARCFLTNPSLGVTIVGCEPVSFEVPLDIETAKVSRNILRVGSSIYVLGHIEHDDKRRGLVTFGKGRISSEGEQVIEFYSLDGKVWAPGSAGFDEQGDFAFVVGDSKLPSGAQWDVSPVQKGFQSEKDSDPKQPGILAHFVREWIRTVWGFAELIKERHTLVSSALPGAATEDLGKDPIPPIHSVPNTLQELQSDCEGPKGVGLPIQSNLREQDLPARKYCGAMDCSFSSVGSPMQACTISDDSRFSSNLGGIPDFSAKELEGLIEPNHGVEAELSPAIDRDNRSTAQNGFMTGVVKVKYFNKNVFSPDQMPVTDNPKQDPNGGSWFDWGKKAPKSRSLTPKSTDFPVYPKDTAQAAYGDPLEVRLAFLNNDQPTIPEWNAPEPIKSWQNSKDSGLQPLRPDIFTSSPPRDFSQWTVLRVDARSSRAPTDSHPRSPPLSSPKVSSPVSHFIRPFNPTLQVDSPPREFAFGLIHRSTTSPRSPGRAKAMPWKPPGSHGSGDPGSPQNLKFGSENRKVPPVGFPREGTPRLFRGLKKRFYELTKSAEARTVRKSRERVPEKPRWSAHSRVHKKDDYKKLAALPPRLVKPGEFPAEIFTSHFSGPAQSMKGTAGSRNGKKEEMARDLTYYGEPNVFNFVSQQKNLNSPKTQQCLASPKSTMGRKETGMTATGCSKMPAIGLICKDKEEDQPKLRVKRLLTSSSSWVQNFPGGRAKKCGQQSSSKHARKKPEPLASGFHAQTNHKAKDQQRISCNHAPKGTLVSPASTSPRVLSGSNERVTTPMKKCKPIRRDEEILKEIENLQAVLRSPRDKSIPRECQGRSPLPEKTVGDASQEVDSKTVCNRHVEITKQKSEEDTGLTCSQYWKNFITARRDAAVESLKAMIWSQLNAGAKQHVLKIQPNIATRAEPRTPKVQPNAAPRAEQHTPRVYCSPAREGMNKNQDSKKQFKINHSSPRPPWRQNLPGNENTAFVFISPVQSPKRHKEAKVWDGNCCVDVWHDPLKIQPEGKQSHHTSKPDSQIAGQQQSKVVTGSTGTCRHREAKDYQFYSPRIPGQQSVELECIPTMRDTGKKPWDGTCGVDVWYDPLKTQPEGKQTYQSSKPDSRIVAGQQQQRSKVVTGGEGRSSSGPAHFLVSPSNAAAPNSHLDGERKSPRKCLSTSPAVPETGHPAMSSGQRRPWSPDTRVDRRTTKTDHRVAARNTKKVMRECSNKTLISSEDIELEALIFDTENEHSAPLCKRSGVPELAIPKQKLQNGLAHPETAAYHQENSGLPLLAVAKQKLQKCLAHPNKAASYRENSRGSELAVVNQRLPKCLAHPDKEASNQDKSGLREFVGAKQKLQKCLAHPDKAGCYPEKPSVRFGSKTNVPSLVKGPEKRTRPGTTMNHPCDVKRARLGKPSFTAEIGTHVISSEDGSSISEMGPIVRYEGRAQVAPADQQQGEWVPQWRP